MVLVTIIGIAAACSADRSAEPPPDPCTAVVNESVEAREIEDQLELLDRALVVCRSSAVFAAALDRYPDALGVTPAEFAQARCEDPPSDRVETSSICRELAPVTTTVPVILDSEIETYLAVTLDGREIVITSDTVRFTEGRPAVIVQITDTFAEDGCTGVEGAYREWVGQVVDPETGDVASAYAQHALNILRFFGCPPPT